MNKPEEESDKFNPGKEEYLSVAEAKSKFAACISKAAYADKKIVITKRGKPVAALVSVDDLKKIKSEDQYGSLTALLGKWKDFQQIEKNLEYIYKARTREKDRDVSL